MEFARGYGKYGGMDGMDIAGERGHVNVKTLTGYKRDLYVSLQHSSESNG